MKYKNLIVDGNNLFWRATVQCLKSIIDEQEDEDDQEFYAVSIEETLKRINDLIKRFSDYEYKVYLLYDNTFSKINHREAIYPSYKHARKNKNIPPILYKSLDKLIEILKVYNDNFIIVRYNGCEADDLVPTVLYQCKDESSLLISADLDWSRGISDIPVHWFNFEDVYSKEKFFDRYGFNPSQNGVKLYKAIKGDSSDNIENAVPYLPKSILLTIIDKYNSLTDLMTNLWKDDEIPQQWKLKIKEAEIQLKINYQLVDYLNIDIPFSETAYYCKEDINALRSWFTFCGITFENRMFDRKKDAHLFLEKKKSRRYF